MNFLAILLLLVVGALIGFFAGYIVGFGEGKKFFIQQLTIIETAFKQVFKTREQNTPHNEEKD